MGSPQRLSARVVASESRRALRVAYCQWTARRKSAPFDDDSQALKLSRLARARWPARSRVTIAERTNFPRVASAKKKSSEIAARVSPGICRPFARAVDVSSVSIRGAFGGGLTAPLANVQSASRVTNNGPSQRAQAKESTPTSPFEPFSRRHRLDSFKDSIATMELRTGGAQEVIRDDRETMAALRSPVGGSHRQGTI